METTDWLATLRVQAALGKQMVEEVPRTLANPGVTVEQIRCLFEALDHQAHFVETLVTIPEEGGYDSSSSIPLGR